MTKSFFAGFDLNGIGLNYLLRYYRQGSHLSIAAACGDNRAVAQDNRPITVTLDLDRDSDDVLSFRSC